jgi:Glycosyltransferase family 43
MKKGPSQCFLRRGAALLTLAAVVSLSMVREVILPIASLYTGEMLRDVPTARIPPRTAMRPTADALDAAPETGLDSIEPFVLPTEGVLEHLGYHHSGAGDVMRSLATTDPLVYFVTPTYYRATQMADMTRLSQTLMHDKRIYWVVIEDKTECTVRIRALLERTGLPFAHLAVPTARAHKNSRGMAQRNSGLEVVEQVGLPGVVYFGDDDNSYDGTSMK